MGEKTVILSTCVPKALAEKVMAQAKEGGYISVSDYLRDVLRSKVMS